MARREYARIGVDMPEEASIKALSVEAQWLYDRLLLRPEISRCGVIPWVPTVIAELAPNATERKVVSWVKQLQPAKHVILDDKHAQLLVRTFVKHDKLLAQPNVVPNLVYEFGLISSPKVRLAFLQEFRRLWSLTPDDDFSDSERGGWLLAVRHFPVRKDPDNAAHKDLRWPIALDARTLGRLTKEIGTGLYNALTSAIIAGDVEPFTADDRYGIPDPFDTPHPTTPPRHPTPTPHPGRGPVRTRAHSETETETETETGSFGPPTPASVSPDPAATAADTHTPTTTPTDPDQLVTQHGGKLTGAVRLALTTQTRQLLDEHIDPTTIAAGLTLWRERPGSGPGLLAYLVNDLMQADHLRSKPKHTVNGDAPKWCGRCDQTNRWEDTGTGWRRCPRCHPLNAASNSSAASDPPAHGGVLAMSGPDDPPF